MAKFYFTYGSDERFLFQYGWTEVEAPDYETARSLFQYYHPDRNPEAQYADVYTEDEFFYYTMTYMQGYRRHHCHERITLMRELPDKTCERRVDGTMKTDYDNKKRLREISGELESATRTLFGMSFLREVVILDVDIKTSGYVLLESGIEKFADIRGLSIETEPAEDENGLFAFKVVRLLGGIEVLQVDDEYVPEEKTDTEKAQARQ